MLHACAVRFDVIKIFEKFLVFGRQTCLRVVLGRIIYYFLEDTILLSNTHSNSKHVHMSQ